MIISGEYYLLLDPSRRFLGNRASRLIKLRDMRRYELSISILLATL